MAERIDSTRRIAPSAATSLSVKAFRHPSELLSIADEWDHLVFKLTGRPPITSYSWVSSLVEHRQSHTMQFLCLAAFDNDRLVGVLPLSVKQTKVLGKPTVQLVQAGEPRSNCIDMVALPGRELEVATAFRDALDDEVPGWFGLELLWVDHQSPLVLLQNENLENCTVVRHVTGCTSLIPTHGNWDEYNESLTSNFRRQVRRRYQRLAKDETVVSEFLSGSDAHPRHLERFLKVEASGWKGQARSAIAADPAKVEFYRTLSTKLYKRGMLEWHFLRCGEHDVATSFSVRSGKTLFVYKIGYDESYSNNSPGILLLHQILKRAYEDPETDSANFVTDRSWHKEWLPKKLPYYHLWIYPHRPRSIIAGAIPKQLKQGLRRIPGIGSLARLIRGPVREGSAIQSRLDFLQSQRTGETDSNGNRNS